ncbi:MAG: TetR/AcrR family transcriptional regulator [Deltaproteobacteria bacterium]|nr:TetR/AcrR family transcriptional regulator [Deltaproteobacteria bacterium]
MPRPALSQDAIEAYRERIIDAATHLFAERGYAGVTMRAIAAELGCSPMTPYRYFRDKDEIFAMIKAGLYARFAQAQEQASRASLDPLDRLGKLGGAYVQFAFDDPDGYRIMFEIHRDPPESYAELDEAALGTWRPLRDAVAQAVEAGVITGNPDVVAHLLWAGLHGVITLHLAGKLTFGAAVKDLVEPMMATLVRGNSAPGGN